MRKVYCDYCKKVFSKDDSLLVKRHIPLNDTQWIMLDLMVSDNSDMCDKCRYKIINGAQDAFNKIKEEFENGKKDKTLRKCHHCGCEFSVAYSGNIDGKKYCSKECYENEKNDTNKCEHCGKLLEKDCYHRFGEKGFIYLFCSKECRDAGTEDKKES